MDKFSINHVIEAIETSINNKAMEIIKSTGKIVMEYDTTKGAYGNEDLSAIITQNAITTGGFVNPSAIDDKAYVYFIFDHTNEHCLYVGKSKAIKTRLEQHLVCNKNSKTSSKLKNVAKYIKDVNTKLYIVVLDVEQTKIYGAIEGQFIEYIEEHQYDKTTIKDFWNTRHD